MTTRPAPKKSAAAPKRPATTKEPVHGVPALVDHSLKIAEKVALRLALLIKQWRRALLKNA
jgi:hypothetical protein